MKLVPIDKIPTGQSRKSMKYIQSLVDEFNNSSATQVEIIFTPNDYVSPHSCYCSFFRTARISGCNIQIRMVGDRIFMKKIGV